MQKKTFEYCFFLGYLSFITVDDRPLLVRHRLSHSWAFFRHVNYLFNYEIRIRMYFNFHILNFCSHCVLL